MLFLNLKTVEGMLENDVHGVPSLVYRRPCIPTGLFTESLYMALGQLFVPSVANSRGYTYLPAIWSCVCVCECASIGLVYPALAQVILVAEKLLSVGIIFLRKDSGI